MLDPAPSGRGLPSWFYGLPHCVGGAFIGYVFIAIPILLRARGVSVEHIAWVAAVAGSPISWAFLVAPILDAQWSRRTYVLVLTCIAAVCAGASVLLLDHLTALTPVLTLGETAGWLSAYACYGWQSEFLEPDQQAAVCGWSEMCNLAAGGAFGGASVWMVRTLGSAAPLGLTATLLLPILAALQFPHGIEAARSARQVFRTFFRDLYEVTRERRCRYALLVFLVPEAAFAFAFAAVGSDFHAPEQTVALVTGPLAAIACSLGCLLGIPLCRGFPAQLCYIGPGLAAALASLVLVFCPKDPVSFTIGALLYVMMQGINFTAFATLALQLAGKANPLATTLITLLGGVSNISVIAMKAIDGHGYTLWGVRGMLMADGAVGLATGIPLLIFLYHADRRYSAGERQPDMDIVDEPGELPA